MATVKKHNVARTDQTGANTLPVIDAWTYDHTTFVHKITDESKGRAAQRYDFGDREDSTTNFFLWFISGMMIVGTYVFFK